jgi:hypothetical protein
MASVLDSILSQVDGGTVDRMASQLGVSPGTVQQAMPAVLSTILGGLARNASQPEGAEAIHGALNRDHDGSLLDNLSGLLGGGGGAADGGGLADLIGGGLGALLGGGGEAADRAGGGIDSGGRAAGGGGLLEQGGAILGHIFGGRQSGVASQVGHATGIDKGTAAQLLMMLAPIVMSYLGKLNRQRGLDSGGLADVLGGARQEAQESSIGGMLGSILDADHDGSVIDDLGGMLGGLLGGKR